MNSLTEVKISPFPRHKEIMGDCLMADLSGSVWPFSGLQKAGLLIPLLRRN